MVQYDSKPGPQRPGSPALAAAMAGLDTRRVRPDPDQPQVPTVAQLRVICFALLAGVLLFGVVVAFVLDDRGSGFAEGVAESLPLIGVAVSVVCTIAAFVARSVVWRSLGGLAGAARQQRYATGVILFAALLEAAALMNVIVWLLTGQSFPTLLAVGLPFAVALLLGLPSEEQRDALVEQGRG